MHGGQVRRYVSVGERIHRSKRRNDRRAKISFRRQNSLFCAPSFSGKQWESLLRNLYTTRFPTFSGQNDRLFRLTKLVGSRSCSWPNLMLMFQTNYANKGHTELKLIIYVYSGAFRYFRTHMYVLVTISYAIYVYVVCVCVRVSFGKQL